MDSHKQDLDNKIKYYNEFHNLTKGINELELNNDKLLTLHMHWIIKKASEYFFDEMDYFDSAEITLDEKANLFCERMELLVCVSWTELKIIDMYTLYHDDYKK